MIGIDWGTSNFRAFRIDHGGTVIDRRSSAGGILRIEAGRYAEALLAQVGDWLAHGENRILLSGMVGSRNAWMETGYLPCPVGLAELANAVVRVPLPDAEVLLIPGVSGFDASGVPEVMRGEETEAIGTLDACGGDGLICLPGTHSKWIEVKDYAISSFITSMTGDVFAALRSGTILSRMMTEETAVDRVAFLRGVARSADPGGLLHHLFSVRTLALVGELKEEVSSSFLSGLLIGHEVRGALSSTGRRVHLVGDARLCELYALAIGACSGSFTMGNDDAAARGLAAIGRRLGWI